MIMEVEGGAKSTGGASRSWLASSLVTDSLFDDPRFAPLYDHFEGERPDLEVYAAMVDEFGAKTVLDVGCGTGVFACMMALRGCSVIGVDPAGASLDVARAKDGADRVRWIHGDATTLPELQVDLAIMTGNVAQVFLTDEDWLATLRGIHQAMRPGGRLVFETRDPAKRAWESWTRENSFVRIEVDGIGTVESWDDVTSVDGSLVTFRSENTFLADGTVVTGESTLRFRSREEVEESLVAAGFAVSEISDAPDRPGNEFVFVCTRS
jgi:SAM-dependent methyltransferase